MPEKTNRQPENQLKVRDSREHVLKEGGVFASESMPGAIREEYSTEKVRSRITLFGTAPATQELNLLIEPVVQFGVSESWEIIFEELQKIENEQGFDPGCRLFMRVFLNDSEKYLAELQTSYPDFFGDDTRNFISLVQQPLLSGANLALWVYAVKGEQAVQQTDFGKSFRSNGLDHLWVTNLQGEDNQTVFQQTEKIFKDYTGFLSKANSNVFDHAVRTWLFVDDIDFNYADVVKARGQFFRQYGLTEETHYIASTGIEGKHENPNRKVFMDAYSIGGIVPEQIRYLQASANMCPTHRYGVTFERGTEICYGDRKHVFISGTASINTKGEVLYVGDAERQTLRVFENINSLLKEANCSVNDLSMLLVYIREHKDYEIVKRQVEILFPNIPSLILLAPVCRPSWLVEIEGIAIKNTRTDFPNF